MFKQLAVVATFFCGLVLNAQTVSTHTAASPDAVCSFITGKMTSALQQVPSLCTGTMSPTGRLSITVLATKNVFQTDLRRAWSSALFQSVQSIRKNQSLHDTCFAELPKCVFQIEDSDMAESRLHYLLLPQELLMNGLESRATDLSEDWYQLWWQMLSKEADRPQSKENAESLAEIACNAYQKETEPWAHISNQRIPRCSTMVATDKAVVIVIDYDDPLSAMDAANGMYLMRSIGKSLSNTAYKGTVIIRSPWAKRGDTRVYNMYDLGRIGFAYDEFHSGTRSEVSAAMLLSPLTGQKGSNKFDAENASFEYIARIAPSQDGATLIDTSDGAEWKTTAASITRCPLVVGNYVFLNNDEKPTMLGFTGAGSCEIDISFVTGW